jgi:hypothetical protein
MKICEGAEAGLHALVALVPEKESPVLTVNWTDPRDGLIVVQKSGIAYFGKESKSGPCRSLDTMLTEVTDV